MSELPTFPIDDSTLLAVEHALDFGLSFEDDNGTPLDEPRGVGADYSLHTLMDFLAGVSGDDGRVLISDDRQADEARGLLGLNGGIPVYYDGRVTYQERDIIRALITEVRRLRGDDAG